MLGKLVALRQDFSEWRQFAWRRRAAEAAMLRAIEARIAALPPRPPAPPASGRGLVMGMAAGYGPAALAPFVRSLRGSAFQGDIVLLLADAPAGTREWLAGYGVEAFACESVSLLGMAPHSGRMFRLLELLEDRLAMGPYSRVLMADTRDVVFQADPCAGAESADLHVFLEGNGHRVADCPLNSDWMRRAMGEAGLQRHAEEPISCVGTVIATPGALRAYLLHMCRLILLAPQRARHSGLDTAAHIHIVAEGLVGGTARRSPNGELVQTVPTARPHGVSVGPDGVLRNADGTVSAIVHQYDRDPVLNAAVAERWGLPPG